MRDREVSWEAVGSIQAINDGAYDGEGEEESEGVF
jgi:hypothetical protein